MKNDKTVERLMEEINEHIAWFNSDNFKLDDAKEKFLEVNSLASQIEKKLTEMKNEIEVLGKNVGK